MVRVVGSVRIALPLVREENVNIPIVIEAELLHREGTAIAPAAPGGGGVVRVVVGIGLVEEIEDHLRYVSET